VAALRWPPATDAQPFGLNYESARRAEDLISPKG